MSSLLIEKSYEKFEVFTAVTMKNVFWDIKTQFVPHRKQRLCYRGQPVNAM
jgi:hypothetical protein